MMHTIGVTGGIGAGKSEVLNYLKDSWGAAILKLDDVSRSFLDRGGRCYEEALRLFGPKIRREDGTLDRLKKEYGEERIAFTYQNAF